MTKDKPTFSSVRHFFAMMTILMILIFGALSLASHSYKNLYEATVIHSDGQRFELVNFKCKLQVGSSLIKDVSSCTISATRSKLSIIEHKLLDLETSKLKTSKCGFGTFLLAILCAIIDVFKARPHNVK